ncbi:caspase family protein [Rhizobium sp. KVB221]|uniref:Caspase family protein n=1 Tax=Rhizobium setariae TaxID=2801340 RepID=A0A937CRQ9_9HYPH|nr:caspase family protein [Rhizobium setariae]MBL0375067.1 caspase family protein [Rhizobium setariae]
MSALFDSARMAIRLLAVLLVALCALPALASSRVALVIGMSKYQTIPTLANTLSDATDIATTLRKLGFQVETSIDQPLVGLVKTLNDFSFKAETAEIAMVYYAGHGVELNGDNFLIPVDIRITKPEQIASQAITLKNLLNSVANARRLRIVILDSCRNNPFTDWPSQELAKASSPDYQTGEVTKIRTGGLAAPSADKGMLVVYAAKDGEVALDGESGHSPFARALLSELPARNIEIGMMFRRVRDKVMQETRNKQEPHFYGSLSGIPYFLAGADMNVAALTDPKKAWGSLAPDQELQLASLVEDGNVRAMIGLGYMSLSPDKSRFKPQKAFELFSRASTEGDPEAMFELAKLYEKGIGVNQDFTKAVELYQKSADLGFADAINDLGFLYYQGASGLARDRQKAIELFLKAADLRHPQAMYNVAALIDDGTIKGKTPDDAARYLYAALRSGVKDVLAQLSDRPNQFKPATRKALQAELAKNRFYSGKIDGSIGQGTQRSMRIAFGETAE